MELKPGYKQTEIGVIPEDWTVSNLPDSVWFQEGPGLRNWQFTKSGLKVINITNLKSDGFLDLEKTDRHISWHEFEKMYKHFLIDEDDFVMASSGNSYCKTSVVRKCDLPLLMNTSVIRFKPLESINKDYMEAYLKSAFFKDQIDLLITGGAQPNFGPAHLKLIKIPLPPTKAEQEAIAKALSDMDALIQSLEQQIIKKQQIKQGAMQSLLNPFDAHGDLKTGWKQTKLGKIAEFINGRAYGLHEWENSGVPVIRLQNLTGRGTEYYYSTLNLPEKQYCNNGDLLFMWSATFGPVIWKGEKAIFHYHIWKIQCIENKADKDFLYYVLDDLTEKLKRTSSSGGTMLHVTKEKMESTEVTIPEVEVQADISSALKEIDSEIGELKLKLSKHQKLKQGMMQNLLTGTVRLV